MPSLNTYLLLDAGDFQKLEQVGSHIISRPSPQAVWPKELPDGRWKKVDAHFKRHAGGDGTWQVHNPLAKKDGQIEVAGVKFITRLTEFGHLGIFPEQAQNWQTLSGTIRKALSSSKDFSVLNLFAYTGGSTMACALAGAKLAHVDASKTSVAWARENARANRAEELPVRWIVEDVKKFVGRELKRGSRYQGIILDPPSFGRGNKNEVWKIETDLPILLAQLNELLADDFRFVLLSAHSPGYTPVSLENLLRRMPKLKTGSGTFISEEMLITCQNSELALPSGASSLYIRN